MHENQLQTILKLVYTRALLRKVSLTTTLRPEATVHATGSALAPGSGVRTVIGEARVFYYQATFARYQVPQTRLHLFSNFRIILTMLHSGFLLNI